MRKPFYRTKKFIFGMVLLLVSGGGCAAVKALRQRAETARLAGLTPVRPERVTLVVKTQATGTVEPENRVLVTPSVGGRAEEVLFAEGREVRKGEVLAWISSSERTALLDSLKMKDSSPEERRMVEEAYNLTPVVAPIDGMVIKRAVEPGQSVSPAKEIAVISDRLIVKTYVDETDIGGVKEGQRAEFYLDAFPKERRAGRVLAISHESAVRDGVTVYEVKILPEGSASALRSGMTADVLIITGAKKNALTVPKKAVKDRDGEARVSARTAAGEPLAEKTIKVGASDESRIEVTDGLGDGDTVYYSTGVPKERTRFTVGF